MRYDPFRHFVFRYFFAAIIMYIVFFVYSPNVIANLHTYQQHLTIEGVRWLLGELSIEGFDIWINPSYKIIITPACNGFLPLTLIWAFLIAYPTALFTKAAWIVIAYIVVTLANILRISFVVYSVSHFRGKEDFFWAHDVVGNAILLIVGLLLTVVFIKNAKR